MRPSCHGSILTREFIEELLRGQDDDALVTLKSERMLVAGHEIGWVGGNGRFSRVRRKVLDGGSPSGRSVTKSPVSGELRSRENVMS